MYSIIGLPKMIWIFGWTTLSVLLLIALGKHFDWSKPWHTPALLLQAIMTNPREVPSLLSQAVSATGVVFWVFGRWLWRRLWRWCPSLERGLYPDLNGTWIGNIFSNWPIIESMAGLSKDSPNTIPPATLEPTSPYLKVPVEVTIEADWFKMTMNLRSAGDYSESRTLALVPLRDLHGRHRLAYVFENQTVNYRDTDTPWHRGAAVLSIELNGSKQLKGEYWTNRSWKSGLNTAGTIELELAAPFR